MGVTQSPDVRTHVEYSFWLIPAKGIREQLRSIILRLANETKAVHFEPHMTIYSGTSDDAEIQNLASALARTFTALKLAVLTLDHTDNYTKTLFIRLKDPGPARCMFEAIKKGSARPSEYVLDPHLSLLYKTLPAATRTEICQTLDVPRGTYVFDRLCVIETEIPLTRPEQIKKWRVVYDSPLGSQ